MNERIMQNKKGIAALAILAVLAWAAISFAGFGTAEANNASADCPNGPLRADLTGAGTGGGRAPSGSAMFKERGSNALTVMVRGVSAASGTTLTVMIGSTNVGTITLAGNGNGQLRIDSASGIEEGTPITVMNGTTTVLSGTFACVAGGGKTNGNTNTNTNTNTNGNTNTNTNTNGNTNTNTNTNTNGNTNTNMNMNMDMNMNTNSNTNTSPTPR